MHVLVIPASVLCVCVLVLVPLHMQGQVIRSGEGARADRALERFGPCVFPEVTSQLIRTGETPVTSIPRTPVRLLTSVGPQVGFQMGRLGVHFLTSWEVTVVYPPLLQVWVGPAVVADLHGLVQAWSWAGAWGWS